MKEETIKSFRDIAVQIEETLSNDIAIHPDSPIHNALSKILKDNHERAVGDASVLEYDSQLEALKQLYIKAYIEKVQVTHHELKDISDLILATLHGKYSGEDPLP